MRRHNRNVLLTGLALLLIFSFLSASCLPGLQTPSQTLPPASSVSPSTGQAAIDEAWKALFQDYVDKTKLDPEKLSAAAIKAMVEALNDPYTTYLTPHVYSMEMRDIEGKYGGIGAYVGTKDQQVVILGVFPDTPAEKAGLKPGDAILEVDGQSTSGQTVTEVVSKIRGPAGTNVSITIRHDGSTDIVTVTITREDIQRKTVTWQMKGDVAYVDVAQFSSPTAPEFDAAVSAIVQEQGGAKVAGLILDLRSNPGGLLDTVVDMASHFVSDGVVVSVVDRDGGRSDLRAMPRKQQLNLPVVILVDEYSASGSEVLSGALRDRTGAKLVGHKTFGKGSVNIFRPLPDGGALYITHSRWLTPNGTLIEGQGLQPDIQSDLKGDDLVNWAIDYLHQQQPAKSSLQPAITGA